MTCLDCVTLSWWGRGGLLTALMDGGYYYRYSPPTPQPPQTPENNPRPSDAMFWLCKIAPAVFTNNMNIFGTLPTDKQRWNDNFSRKHCQRQHGPRNWLHDLDQIQWPHGSICISFKCIPHNCQSHQSRRECKKFHVRGIFSYWTRKGPLWNSVQFTHICNILCVILHTLCNFTHSV